MPTYDFGCRECDIVFEVVLHMNDIAVADCPLCGKVSSERLVTTPPTVFVKNANTLMGLAEKNTRAMGGKRDEVIAEIMRKRATGATFKGQLPDGASVMERTNIRPWYRKDSDKADTKLAKASPEALQKYIMTGKRPFGT